MSDGGTRAAGHAVERTKLLSGHEQFCNPDKNVKLLYAKDNQTTQLIKTSRLTNRSLPTIACIYTDVFVYNVYHTTSSYRIGLKRQRSTTVTVSFPGKVAAIAHRTRNEMMLRSPRLMSRLTGTYEMHVCNVA